MKLKGVFYRKCKICKRRLVTEKAIKGVLVPMPSRYPWCQHCFRENITDPTFLEAAKRHTITAS